MDDDSPDENPSGSYQDVLTRYRSPSFTKCEIKELLDLLNKHKNIVLNKCTNSAANYAKDVAWDTIAKCFNSKGISYERSPSCLKVKWENLKRDGRRSSKSVMHSRYGTELTNQILELLQAAESIGDENFTSELETTTFEESSELNNSSNDLIAKDNSNDGDKKRRYMERTKNFTSKECKLLLKCVRQEKNIIFSKAASPVMKNKAWIKISDSYNKQSPIKKPMKVLRTKFINMRALTRKVDFKGYLTSIKNKKHERLLEHMDKDIKTEPPFEYGNSPARDCEGHSDCDNNDAIGNIYTNTNGNDDPLSSVLNSDSGIGSCSSKTEHSDDKEVRKLKLDLLNYQMETEKLIRKRLEEAIQNDKFEREAKALETSLRLRTARLEAVAAESKLPAFHRALAFTADEMRAQLYLNKDGSLM